jgi:rubrerythrin
MMMRTSAENAKIGDKVIFYESKDKRAEDDPPLDVILEIIDIKKGSERKHTRFKVRHADGRVWTCPECLFSLAGPDERSP